MPRSPRRHAKKKLPATSKKTVKSRGKKKTSRSVQVFPPPTLLGRIRPYLEKSRTLYTQLVTTTSTKQVALKKWVVTQVLPAAYLRLERVRTLVLASAREARATLTTFGKKIWIRLLPILTLLYRELIYPFYYVFRFHPIVTALSLLSTVFILGASYLTYEFAFRDLPQVSAITARQQLLTTKILDRNGVVLYRIFKDENRTLVPLDKVPLHVRQATIAIEDRDFYYHQGISLRGMLRAVRENTQGNKLQGGSTITQQLVKNTLLSPEQTIKRKVREIILALLVEQTYSKDQILEMYLNEVAYGGSTYGIEEAAQRYFGKSARALTLAEGSFLAGLPAAPSAYSPFGNDPARAYTRQREVLRRMVEDEYITQEVADAARNETLVFRTDTTDIKAPHFVMYVRDILEKQFGENAVNHGGLEVRTTLDLTLHQDAQELLTKEVDSLTRLRVSNGAALVTNPQTGEVLTMIGSKNYFDFKNDGQVNVTTRPRQPGSSIKPLTYAMAFERGQSPYSTIQDQPITFSIAGSPPYSPKNYDGKFRGNVTLRESLASSYNIPAVKLLAGIGLTPYIDKAESIGISTWADRRRFGLSLTLGGGEVLMTDMAQLYGTFAHGGVTTTLNPLLEVKNPQGDLLYENTCALEGKNCPTTKNFSSKTAVQITDVLSDNAARSPAFGARSVLYIPGQQVAVKTGTTNNLRDNWTIGYTTDRVVAVWVGNNNNTPMSYVASGVTGASPIWNKITRLMLDDAKPHQFATPAGMVRVRICVPTQTLVCRGCPVVREELFDIGTQPTTACSPAQFRPAPSPSPNPDQILTGATTP